MDRWTVRNVPNETINKVKQLAVDRGCSIAEVLSQEFGGECKVYKRDSWTIYNVPESVKESIKARARKLDKPVWVLLKALVEQKAEKEVEKDLRIELVNGMRRYLKEFRKG